MHICKCKWKGKCQQNRKRNILDVNVGLDQVDGASTQVMDAYIEDRWPVNCWGNEQTIKTH